MFGLFEYRTSSAELGFLSEPTMADTYREVLRDFSSRRINRVIENDTFEDSSSVYERFFLDCDRELRIVARGIKKEIFERPNVIAAAKEFFMKDSTKLVLDLRAKSQKDAYETCATEFFRAISDSASGKNRLEVNFYIERKPDQFMKDFPSVSLGDGRMYRKRTYQTGGDYTTHANADVNFNDPAMVSDLKILMDDALQKEEKLDF